MKLLIDINHPAHVHVFRHAALHWQSRGDLVYFTAADKDVARRLLDAYQLPYEIISVRRPGKFYLALELVSRTHKLIQIGRRYKPDVILSVGSPTAAFASKMLGVPHIAFDDTEDSVGQAWLYRPFTRTICVPDCFGRDFGKKMVRYAGYHELTYLHPNRFTPDASKIVPLKPDETFFVVRFIHFDAAHDVGERGLSQAGREKLLNLLLAHGPVVLSLEKNPPLLLPPKPLSLYGGGVGEPLSADAMHHFLAFATLYVGEGVTAASEAAVLGTPSLLINTRQMGYILEQQDKYHLGYIFDDEQAALGKVEKMLRQDDLKAVWQYRRQVMLRDKIDVTAWLVTLVDDTVS
jgi:hypothetical protein